MTCSTGRAAPPPDLSQAPTEPASARRWLDGLVDFETAPEGAGEALAAQSVAAQSVAAQSAAAQSVGAWSPDAVARILRFLGDPQVDLPVIHVTGTNGKGSVVAIAASLLEAAGLSTTAYTSPDQGAVEERLSARQAPVSPVTLDGLLELVRHAAEAAGVVPSRFEALTAAALRFAGDEAPDAALVEVGLGGRDDATNVVDARVAVVTNVGGDHLDLIGPTLADVARHKGGIVGPGSVAVVGEERPELVALLLERGPRDAWLVGRDFGVRESRRAVGGRTVELWTRERTYGELFLPLAGAHQATNAAIALAAVEAFVGAPLSEEVVGEGLAAVRVRGRLEVAHRRPVVLLDGAHNPPAAAALAAALDEDWGGCAGWLLVIGMVGRRSPEEFLAALDLSRFRGAWVAAPAVARAVPARRVAAAVAAHGMAVSSEADVAAAVRAALRAARPDEAVLVTGSFRVVAEARNELGAP